jgi:oxygen-dependent protoporphyrinogen oxidase
MSVVGKRALEGRAEFFESNHRNHKETNHRRHLVRPGCCLRFRRQAATAHHIPSSLQNRKLDSVRSDLSPTRRVAVVGGGVTGLSAALRLTESWSAGCVEVLEASTRLGGVIQTERRDGFTLELGPDSLLRRMPWGVGLCKRLGIDDQLVGTQPVASGTFTVHRGRTTRMPEGLAIMAPDRVWPMVATPILSWRGKLRLAAERALPRRTSASDESLAQFARRRLGCEAFERIVQPLAGGIFMGDPERLSLQACFPQFAAMEAEHGSLIKATRAAKKKRSPPSHGGPSPSVFVAPAEGLGRIIDALGSALGGEAVRLGQQVKQLEPASSGWRLTVEDTVTGRCTTEEFNAVIIATPANVAARLLQPVDARLGGLLAGVGYSSCAIVHLAYPLDRVRHPLDAAGLVVPHVEGRPMQACSFYSVKYAGRAPDGVVVLRAFFGGALHPELTALDDDCLTELAQSEVATLLGAEGQPLLASVTRWPKSMPQYQVGHLQLVDKVERCVERHAGLELAGAAYRGVGIPHCIHSGEQAAERILAAIDQTSGKVEQAPAGKA